MRGRILLGVLLFSFSILQAQSFKCFLSENHYSHGLNLNFNQTTEKFTSSMEYASSHFPELDGVQIEIRRKSIGTLMAARPKISFLFRKKENRKYVVFISDKPKMNAGLIFEHMSECAQAGVLGHELSHIVTYNEMKNRQLLWFSITYLFRKKEVETETDLIAMKHGLGDQLVEYTRYVHKSPFTNKKYLRKKQKHYLSANEMLEKMLVVL